MKKTVILLFLVVMDTSRSMNIGSANQSNCERITIPMCQKIGYNYTMFPNMFNHRTQTEASLALRHYIPLVDWVCYKWLPKFLCSMFVPVCTNTSVLIPPCRSLCAQSKKACQELMRAFGDQWPAKFNCNNFPEEGTAKLCIKEKLNIEGLTTKPTKQCSNSTRKVLPQTTTVATTSHTIPISRNPNPNSKCRKNEFQCEKYDSNHDMCIPKIWRCDGMTDCKDSSDERFCPTRGTTTRMQTTTKGPTVDPSCQRIRINSPIHNLCGRFSYTYTKLPNRFGHTNQDQIFRALSGWYEVIRKQCSPLLVDFLCRVYVPPCGKDQTKTPCRSMCKKVKKSCRRTLKRLKMKWPPFLRCGKLPKKRCYGAVHKNILPKKVKLSKDNCEKITLKMCQDIGYNYTKFPNMFNHQNQVQVDIEVYQYLPLIDVQCSKYLKMFLCSMYLPICTKTGTRVPPCRSLCEHSKKGCESLMTRYGFGWPAKFNCAKFPKFGNEFCVV